MLYSILLISVGLLLLLKGAEWLVDGGSALAEQYNISPLAIGLTIVAFGTSMPELVVNTYASFQDHHDIVFGNAIGSNNFNLFIILGICGLITPLIVKSSTVRKEIPFSLVGVIILYILCNDFFFANKVLSRIDGVILLLVFGLFILYVYKKLKTDINERKSVDRNLSGLKIWGLIIIGLTGLIIGGRVVVAHAIQMATILGVSEKLIGLTIVAAGTSLPELATSIVSAVKKNIDIAVGNIIGSNVFNISFILGASALINPVEYDTVFNAELYLITAGTIFLFIAMFNKPVNQFNRWEAGILLFVFIGYTIYLFINET